MMDAIDQTINGYKTGRDKFLNWLFIRDRSGPPRRILFLILLFLLYWLVIVLWQGIPSDPVPAYFRKIAELFSLEGVLNSLTGDPGSLQFTISRLVTSFFSLSVLRHLHWFILSYLLVFRTTSNFINEAYGFNNSRHAEKYLQSSLFGEHTLLGTPYLIVNLDKIVTGDKSVSNHPLVRIGGPGKIIVPLEWAALFESIDFQPFVLNPGFHFINGFDRFREAINIKDQMRVRNDIREFSKDGVPVTIQDARILFSIDRSKNEADFSFSPYPYDSSTIQKIVYNRRVTNGKDENWTEHLSKEVISEIRRFVADHPLDEFLAEPPSDTTINEKSTRRDHSRSFYDQSTGFSRNLKGLGQSIIWVNVGTWDIPHQIVPTEHIRAWRLSWENRFRRRPKYQERLVEDARVQTIRALTGGLISTYHKFPSSSGARFEIDLLLAFRQQMYNASLQLREKMPGNLPKNFNKILEYLDRNTRRYL